MVKAQKEWIEIRARGPERASEEASALLVEAGSQGVIEEVPFEPLPFDVIGPVVGDMTKRPKILTLVGYISAEDITAKNNNFKGSFSRLDKALSTLGWSLRSSPFKDQAWTEKWKKFLKPVRAGGFLVRPVWSKAAPKKGEHLIEIEPAMAFGTGGHETTRLCLRAIKASVKDINPAVSGKFKQTSTMLDVGTGSGVLAIAAGKLGFSKIVGTDIDPVALKNARKNLGLNKVQARLTVKPLSELSGTFDLVVANIRSVILLDLMPDIVKKVKPNGLLILSGVLVEEAVDISARFEACGVQKLKVVQCKEWVAITLRKSMADARRR